MLLDSAKLDTILKNYVSTESGDENSLRQASFIVKGKTGETLYSNAVGKLNYDAASPPFTADSFGRVASLTKLLTAVCAMQLVEKGVIGLDGDLGSAVPELANVNILKGFNDDGSPILVKKTKAVTFRNLLTHSSGYCYDSFDQKILKWSAFTGRKDNSQTGNKAGYDIPLLFEPGESWMYGVGCDWASYAVEALSGQSFEDYTKENVFTPLGMLSSTFYSLKHPELAERQATCGFRSSPGSALVPYDDPFEKSPSMISGGAGLWTTPNDYAKLIGSLVSNDGKVLKPESVAELFKPQLPDPKTLQDFADGPFHMALCPEFPVGLPVNFTLGGAINTEDSPGKRRKGSVMWSGATSPRWWVDPTTGIAALMYTLVQPFGDSVVAGLFNELETEVYRALNNN